jgi:tRNA pseudouridine55 synthase
MIDGLLVVDKPSGMTSHDVVGKCRRIVGQRRVGHAGTLDPGATGVLLVGLGRATRLMRYIAELPKSYVAELVLGRTTTTLDDEGETVAVFDMSKITLVDVQIAAAKFVGDILQIPPMVSAVKVGGQRLHELARQGIEVERKARPVTVYRYDVSPADPDNGVYRIEVECSSGTYVRTLAADVGEALGGGAHLRKLRRTAIGSFVAQDAKSLDDLQTDVGSHVLPPAAMVAHFSSVRVDADIAQMVSHGKPLPEQLFAELGDGPWSVLDQRGNLLAVYENGRGGPKAGVVLAAQ